MKNAWKAQSSLLLVLFAGLVAISLATPSAAEEKAPQKRVAPVAAQQTEQVRLEDLKFEQIPVRRIPSKLSVTERQKALSDLKLNIKPIKKVDLVCEIKAYYDQAHTMPVPAGPGGGTYHLTPPPQTPQRPYPFFAFFVVEVRNAGLISNAPGVTNRVVFTSMPPFFAPKMFMTTPETFDPGEAAEYPYYFGPVPLGGMLNGKKIIVNADADMPSRVTEDNEGNNHCTYTLSFVYP